MSSGSAYPARRRCRGARERPRGTQPQAGGGRPVAWREPYASFDTVRAMRRLGAFCAVVTACAVTATCAHAQTPLPETGSAPPLGSDVQHLHYKYGPIHVDPGQNLILLGPVTIEKPGYDGYITRMKPDLVRSDGSVPPVDQIHLHHGVFLNLSQGDSTSSNNPGERMFATGEEKTIFQMPPGYGYFSRGSDVW